jgi:GNAT superfamily N-acetyltransferase
MAVTTECQLLPATTPEALRDAVALMASVHSRGPERDGLEEMSIRYPGFCPEHIRTARIGGEIVSALRITTDTLLLGEARLRLGGVGWIATAPHHRHRGLARSLLLDAFDYLERQNYHVCMVFGIPGFYGQFGFTACLPDYTVLVDTNEALGFERALELREAKSGVVPVLDQDFPVPEGTADRSTMRQYAGVYQADIPEGKHEVTVSNEGSDWFSMLAISIPDLARPTVPPLRVSGVRGETQALVWAQNRLHTWSNKARNLFEIPVIKGAVLELEGFSPGTWVADQIDTQTGEIVSSAEIAVSSEGKASMDLPETMWDAAWRMHKTDSPETGE